VTDFDDLRFDEATQRFVNRTLVYAVSGIMWLLNYKSVTNIPWAIVFLPAFLMIVHKFHVYFYYDWWILREDEKHKRKVRDIWVFETFYSSESSFMLFTFVNWIILKIHDKKQKD